MPPFFCGITIDTQKTEIKKRSCFVLYIWKLRSMEPKLCGMAIQKWRRRRKMTQAELSDASDIPLRTLQNYEAGVLPKKFPTDRAKELAKALRCEPLALIVPEWKQLYEGVLLEVQEVLLAGESAIEKSVEVTRASRELRNWQLFFNALGETAGGTEETLGKQPYDPLKDLVEDE